MVNGKWSVLIHLSSFPTTFTLHTFGTAQHREQFGIQYIAQGQFNMQTGGTGIRTTHSTSRSTAAGLNWITWKLLVINYNYNNVDVM